MYGDLSTFRHIPEQLGREHFADKTNPLIVLRPDSESRFYQAASEKIMLSVPGAVDRSQDLVLRVRQGKYKSDVFHIREEDLPKILFPSEINE